MNGPIQPPEEPISYAVRLKERAFRDINAAYVQIADFVSETAAHEWREGLAEVMAGLSTFPRRNPLAPEKFRYEVRQFLFRRPGSQIAYRILFTISGEEPQSPDPPTVIILHIRHASSRLPTKAQLREIESEE